MVKSQPTEAIILMKFLEILEKSPFPDIKRRIRAEFPAAETADTTMVVKREPAVFDRNGLWRAGVHADPAQAALLRDCTGARGEIVPEPVLQKTGEPKLDI
jgi:hypothetical protein